MLGWLSTIDRDTRRDALRLGVQSAIAAALAWLVAEWLRLDHFLVIMMAVTALERSVGGTMGQGRIRLESAAAGTVLGFLAALVVPDAWGTAPAVALALLVAGTAMALRANWQLAVVPVVGMAIAERGELLDTAGTTALGILLGAVISLLVSFLVWPDRAEARFERQYRRALRATATRLSDAIEATVEEGRTPRVEEHVSAWNEAVWLAAEALGQARLVNREGMERRLDALRELHASVTILDRAAETASPPLSVEVMRNQVERLRRNAVEVLRALSEGREAAAGQRLGAMDATLERLREAMQEDDPLSAEHEAHAAVAFGLREVRRTLLDLIEAQGEEGMVAEPVARAA